MLVGSTWFLHIELSGILKHGSRTNKFLFGHGHEDLGDAVAEPHVVIADPVEEVMEQSASNETRSTIKSQLWVSS